MKIFIEKTGKETKIKFEGRANALLKKLKINPEEVIIARNGEIISDEDTVCEHDEIKILSVVSGG